MMRVAFILFLWLTILSCTTGSRLFRQEILDYQTEQNAKFKNEQASPLTAQDIKTFEALNFFRPNAAFRVTARFEKTQDPEPFEMPTTTDRKPIYIKYGDLYFSIKGQLHHLEVYQSPESMRNPLYRNKVFLPFKDLTCGKESYKGGRYIYMETPKSETVTLDFNKAFNPLCAYNPKYSCPIVPKANYLDVAIKAGVKDYQ